MSDPSADPGHGAGRLGSPRGETLIYVSWRSRYGRPIWLKSGSQRPLLRVKTRPVDVPPTGHSRCQEVGAAKLASHRIDAIFLCRDIHDRWWWWWWWCVRLEG
jgi:hypothetical protein